MLILKVVILCILTFSTYADENEGVPVTPLMAVSPEAAAAVEAISVLKSETSTTISDRHDQAGFAALDHMVDYTRGAIHEDKLDKMIDLWLSDDILSSIEPRHKNVVIHKLKEYSLQIKEADFRTQRYDFKFNDGVGNLFLVIISFKPHQFKQNVVTWDKVLMTASFKPAPPYVIITESDCNLLSCDRTDRIEYMPAMLTDAHTNSLLQISANLLSAQQATNMIAY